MKRRNEDDATVGEDSFLDTTANLVGVLIILVVVIGTKTQIDAQAYGKQLAEQTPNVAGEVVAEVKALRGALEDQSRQTQAYEFESAYRSLERSRLLEEVALRQEENDQLLNQLDDQERTQIEQQHAADKLRKEIADVQDKMGIVDERPRPQVVLEHLPTPMAKTVFSREMHIQLRHGQVTVIPWDRLIDMLKQQIPLAARRQASRRNLADSLGPVGGFLMHYEMVAVPGGFELEQFKLQVVSGAPTESLPTALSPSGRLRLELASRDPAETVVTVWVYPDSFAEFRALKNQLFQEGFLTAARPLSNDGLIGGSPRGSRSSAQ